MRDVVPPAGASDDEIEQFVASLRRDAQSTVRDMLVRGAPADEIVDYINSLETGPDESSIETSPDP